MIKEIDWVSKHKIEYLHLIDNNFGMYKNHRIISDLLIDKLETTGYPNALNITWPSPFDFLLGGILVG